MGAVLHNLALALALLALAQASLRVVSRVAPRGLERLIATWVLGAAAAVVLALALGLASLGASPLALVATALALWAATLAALPAPEVSVRGELATWWAARSPRARFAAAACAGAAGAWVVWQLGHPSIGFDSSLYHYSLVAAWIDNGRPGTSVALSYDIPYGSYPLTDEVALTWATAIARSWVPLALWNPWLLVVLAGAVWVVLRNLSVSPRAAGLGVAALVSAPLVVRQLNEPQTDLPALAWLACATALATSARRRPPLLVPAVLAAGLAIGTKPSTGPMAIAALGAGCYLARGHLRPLARWLALGLLGGFVVGGIWYARNFITHGSPLWPFVQGPWGDPRPRFFTLVDSTFLQSPRATLHGRVDDYVARLGGAWILLAAIPVVLALGLRAPARARDLRRPLVLSGALSVLGLLIWSTAWGTGVVSHPELEWAAGFSLSGLRYILPAIGAAIVSVCLATRSPGPIGGVMTAVLAVTVGWNVVEDAQLGTPWTPPATTVLAGGLIGGAALASGLAVRGRLGRPVSGARGLRPALAAVAALAGAIAFAVAGDGFVERSTRVDNSSAYGRELVAWFVTRPGFERESGTIAIASRGVLAQLAGDRFENRLELVPRRASCQQVEDLARRVPVLVTDPGFLRGLLGLASYSATPACFAGRRAAFDEAPYYVYRIGGDDYASSALRAPMTRTSGSGTMNLPPCARYSCSRCSNSARKCHGSTR